MAKKTRPGMKLHEAYTAYGTRSIITCRNTVAMRAHAMRQKAFVRRKLGGTIRAFERKGLLMVIIRKSPQQVGRPKKVSFNPLGRHEGMLDVISPSRRVLHDKLAPWASIFGRRRQIG